MLDPEPESFAGALGEGVRVGRLEPGRERLAESLLDVGWRTRDETGQHREDLGGVSGQDSFSGS